MAPPTEYVTLRVIYSANAFTAMCPSQLTALSSADVVVEGYRQPVWSVDITQYCTCILFISNR